MLASVTSIVACALLVAPSPSVAVTLTVLVPAVANAWVTSRSVAPFSTGEPSPKSQLYSAIGPSGSQAQASRWAGTFVPTFGGASIPTSGSWLPSCANTLAVCSAASPSSSTTRTRTVCAPAVAKLRDSVDVVAPATAVPSTNQL